MSTTHKLIFWCVALVCLTALVIGWRVTGDPAPRDCYSWRDVAGITHETCR
jgi:hypothetical protein